MQSRLRHTLCATLLALLCSGCDESFSDDAPTGEELVTSTTLHNLNSLVAEGETLRFDHEAVVAGRVTSSDRARNFYRTITLEADGSAIELMSGQERLYNDFPLGAKLYIRLEGLVARRRFGVLQIGTEPASGSYYAVDYLPSKAALDRHVVRSAQPIAELLPERVGIEELNPQWRGRLICIEGVRYQAELTAEGIEQKNQWRGYRRFTDRNGLTIYTYVRDYADFADEPISLGEGSLVGILQYDPTGEGRYAIKLRDEKDFVL